MKFDRRGSWSLLAAVTVMAASAVVGASPASASGPTAGLSIEPASGNLTVELVADSTGFPHPVVSYVWNFGDGQSTETNVPRVTHTYRNASRVGPSVVESDGMGDMATASATMALFLCVMSPCTQTLGNVGTVSSLKVSGPVAAGTPAGVDLLVGRYKINHCESSIAPAVAFTDSGFTGNLTATVVYTTSRSNAIATTCFASTVPFKNTAGTLVTSGALPRCLSSAPMPPCVVSATQTVTKVKKVLLVPPGDPKVGVP
jgi:hypothetical protein